MSDEMKNCCPPETTAPKMEVHDASEGSKDIKPKMISTAHKQLSKDEFQRKVAMVARAKNAMAPAAAAGIRALLPNLMARGSQVGSSIASRLPSWMTGNAAKTVGALSAAGGAGMGIGAAGNMLASKPTTMQSITNALQGGYNTLAQNVGGNIGNIGLLGAGVGAIGGALMPGEEEYEDEDGRIRKRRGSMLAGALRGAGMGGLAGAAGAAGMDAYNSGAFKFGSAVANLEKRAGDVPAQLRASYAGGNNFAPAASSAAGHAALKKRTQMLPPNLQKGLLGGGTGAMTMQLQDKLRGPQAPPFAR